MDETPCWGRDFHPVEPDAASAPTIGMHGVDVPRPNNFRQRRQDQSPGQQRRLRGYSLALSGGVGVTQEALFPMMNASENLNAARILVEESPENGNVDASSIMQLCRSAMDSSARTIWLLSDPDSEVRRDRCLSLLMEQLEQQRGDSSRSTTTTSTADQIRHPQILAGPASGSRA